MKVFVTGATGVLGRAVVPLLAAAGHQVRGLARSEQNDATLRALGAEPVRADLFAVDSLRQAIAGSDAILHLATKIPPTNAASRPAAWAENDRIRREGTRNLVDAALATGVETLIYPSVVFVYRDGGARWLEADTAELDPGPIRSTLEAEAEVARFAATGRRGITLRSGAFYGPGAPSTEDQLRFARRGVALLIGAADAYQPMIWVDDAASAVVVALDRAPSGVYDVVDDEPMQRGELTAVFARAVGRRRLLRPPL
jgi:nucleoside-diphosphate-sugar epimerase